MLQEGAQKRIPIMLVGNKCDVREAAVMGDVTKTCVKHEDGQRLAKVSLLFCFYNIPTVNTVMSPVCVCTDICLYRCMCVHRVCTYIHNYVLTDVCTYRRMYGHTYVHSDT